MGDPGQMGTCKALVDRAVWHVVNLPVLPEVVGSDDTTEKEQQSNLEKEGIQGDIDHRQEQLVESGDVPQEIDQSSSTEQSDGFIKSDDKTNEKGKHSVCEVTSSQDSVSTTVASDTPFVQREKPLYETANRPTTETSESPRDSKKSSWKYANDPKSSSSSTSLNYDKDCPRENKRSASHDHKSRSSERYSYDSNKRKEYSRSSSYSNRDRPGPYDRSYLREPDRHTLSNRYTRLIDSNKGRGQGPFNRHVDTTWHGVQGRSERHADTNRGQGYSHEHVDNPWRGGQSASQQHVDTAQHRVQGDQRRIDFDWRRGQAPPDRYRDQTWRADNSSYDRRYDPTTRHGGRDSWQSDWKR